MFVIEGEDVRRAYGEHGFLCSEFGDLGVEVLSLFGWEEAVEVILAFADDVGDGALEGTRHAAEAAAYHVCHRWKVCVEVGGGR